MPDKSSKITPVTVALIGLLGSLGGAYIVSGRSFDRHFAEVQTQVMQMTKDLQTAGSSIQELRSKIEEGRNAMDAITHAIKGGITVLKGDGIWFQCQGNPQMMCQDLKLPIPPNTFRDYKSYQVYAGIAAFDFMYKPEIHAQLDVAVDNDENSLPFIRFSYPKNSGFASAKINWLAYGR